MPSERRPVHDAVEDGDWVTIARLTRTRGNRGELAAISMTGHPERFADLGEVMLFGAEGFPESPRTFVVESVWEHRGRPVFKFAGVDTIGEAEALRGAEVRVPERERFPLPKGEYYHADLVGCEVVEVVTGVKLGRVRAFREEGGNGMLAVERETGGETLVPFHRSLCVEIDVAAKRIVVDLPPGLLDLNE